jgi:glutamine---fructose-6-phosphate transaminase (isomerizing)
MSTTLLENILAQPRALQQVADYQFGPGLPVIMRCAELLRQSKSLILTGMGASLFACTPMRYALAARGINASVIETAELLYFLDVMLNSGTAVILVSRSGESIETVRLLERLNQHGCPAVGVVNVPDSTLAAGATEHILLNSPADQLVAIQTYSATVVSLLLLAAAYFGDLGFAKAELAATISNLGPWIDTCVAASKTWQRFVDLTSPLYILSRGSGLGSVEEGVLLMHEVAKTPATGMSVAQFRHGFVEAAGREVRAVVIGTQPTTSTLDRQFALDLIQMGAVVRWIGPLEPRSPLCGLGDWPANMPPRFASIFEAPPLQLLAYRTAESRGVVPGVFRWASTITGSEFGFPGLTPS